MSKRDEAADEPSGSQRQPDPTEAPKRGPGRPRKLQQELIGESVPKRARGRPKGSKNKRPSNLQKKVLPSGEKRPRGRPRKWPQQEIHKKPAQVKEEEKEEKEEED